MAAKNNEKLKRVVKTTSQGGTNPKTSSMTKTEKRSYKKYRGQGR